jgi:septal ring factor EnvC (AmiA/AmiB activator)
MGTISKASKNLVSSTTNRLKIINPWYIVLACIGLMIILYIFLFSGTDKVKEENKRLKAENEQIQKQRDSIRVSIDSLKDKLIEVEDSRFLKEIELKDIDDRLKGIEIEVNHSYDKIDGLRADVKSIDKELSHVESKPANRTGDNLLNSLFKKLNP